MVEGFRVTFREEGSPFWFPVVLDIADVLHMHRPCLAGWYKHFGRETCSKYNKFFFSLELIRCSMEVQCGQCILMWRLWVGL